MTNRWQASPLSFLALVTVLGCAEGGSNPQTTSARATPAKAKESAMGFHLTSPAFAPESDIPRTYTCEGADLSPPLVWSGLPEGTKSLALIVDDPDAPDPAAPKTTWVHWVVYDVPPSLSSLPEGLSAKSLPKGAREGVNDWKQTGWRGPCPPVGKHRYFFKLYALDSVLPDLAKPNKASLEKAMHGHVIGHAELMGKYQKH